MYFVKKTMGKNKIEMFGIGKALNIAKGLKEETRRVALIALRQVSLEGSKQMKKIIISQPANWSPLRDKYLRRKIAKGGSEKTLIDTSTMLQAITHSIDEKRFISYSGVFRTEKYKNGESVANIAAIHEFGSVSRNIPARPFVRPALKAVKAFVARKKYAQQIKESLSNKG